MSSRRQQLTQEIGYLASAWQDEVQRFDAAAAVLLGVNATDLRCASLLSKGPLTAKALAEGTGLTKGAVTTVIDRLEAHGLAARKDDPADRRAVVVELTARARKAVEALWWPMVKDGAEMMASYSTAELEVIKGFVEKVIDIQRAHTARVEKSSAKARP